MASRCWLEMLQWIQGLEKIHVPRAWRVYLATGFDFREKNRVFLGSIGGRVCCESPTLPLYYEGKVMKTYFSQKLRVRIKDNKNSPHGKFHQFFFPFSSKFSDLNFASYVLYNLPVLCHVSHTVSLGYLWYVMSCLSAVSPK